MVPLMKRWGRDECVWDQVMMGECGGIKAEEGREDGILGFVGDEEKWGISIEEIGGDKEEIF